MKIEYLADGSPDCPLIRIFDFDAVQVELLINQFSYLANGQAGSITFHELPYIESVNNCKLTARVGPLRLNGEAVVAILPNGVNNSFHWQIEKENWAKVCDLIAPFLIHKPNTYQWLTDDMGIQVLLSQNGLW